MTDISYNNDITYFRITTFHDRIISFEKMLISIIRNKLMGAVRACTLENNINSTLTPALVHTHSNDTSARTAIYPPKADFRMLFVKRVPIFWLSLVVSLRVDTIVHRGIIAFPLPFEDRNSKPARYSRSIGRVFRRARCLKTMKSQFRPLVKIF